MYKPVNSLKEAKELLKKDELYYECEKIYKEDKFKKKWHLSLEETRIDSLKTLLIQGDLYREK